ncbi:DAK2 domain-containing protein, partial [Clostridioides difficile]
MLGGYLRETEGSFSGPLTLSAIEQFNVDKAILGAGGITLENDNISDIGKALSKGSLMGARGNSGVILSQIIRGIAKSIEG